MDTLTRLLLWCGPVAAPVLAAFVAWAAAGTPGYRHLRDSLSQLGAQGRPRARIMGAGLVCTGLLVVAFTAGLARTLEAGSYLPAAFGGLFSYGGGVALTGLVRDFDPRVGGEQNVEGRLHRAFGWLALVSFVVGVLFLGLAVDDLDGWELLAPLSFATAAVMGFLGTIFQLLPARVAGLYQRSQSLIALAWIALIALTALGYLRF